MDGGSHGNPFDSGCRQVMAECLARLIQLLKSFPLDNWEIARDEPNLGLFPKPHSPLFDFERTLAGAEWIDLFAGRTHSIDSSNARPLLGHADWRAEHLRFDRDQIVAVFDWDSLILKPETQLVGTSAASFTADWSREDCRQIPEPDDIRSYINAYEIARGMPFTAGEKKSIFASCVYSIAYGARCEHSLDPDTKDYPTDSFRNLLRAHGESLLS